MPVALALFVRECSVNHLHIRSTPSSNLCLYPEIHCELEKWIQRVVPLLGEEAAMCQHQHAYPSRFPVTATVHALIRKSIMIVY